MKKKNGGSAFPTEQGHIPDGTWNQTYDPGMTMRQWYKGMALQTLAHGDYRLWEHLAHDVAAIADALIAEDEEAE